MAKANHHTIALLEDIRNKFKKARKTIINKCVNPQKNKYDPRKTMSKKEAETYHIKQVRVFENSATDMMTRITMNYVEEAVGIARAAERAKIPLALSFTIETNNQPPTKQTLRSAIEHVDTVTS